MKKINVVDVTVNVVDATVVAATTATVAVVAMAIGLDYPSMLVACAYTGCALGVAGVEAIDTSVAPSGKLTVKK